VRGSGAMAVSPIIDCRCTAYQGMVGSAHHDEDEG